MKTRCQFTLKQLFVATALVAALLGAIQSVRWISARSALQRVERVKHLSMLFVALGAYRAAHGALPPPYIADAEGKPMHSWRVLLLPYLGREDLYKQYRFDEPWNGPHNRVLLSADTPMEYQSPILNHRDDGTTSYLGVVGARTAWPTDRPAIGNGIPDGECNTILLFEVADSAVHWMEPRDMSFEEAAELFRGGASHGESEDAPCSALGTYAISLCGDFFAMEQVPSRAVLTALITPDGHERVHVPSTTEDFWLEEGDLQSGPAESRAPGAGSSAVGVTPPSSKE